MHDSQGHLGSGPSLWIAAREHSADNPPAEIEIPDTENGNFRLVIDKGKALFIGKEIPRLVTVNQQKKNDTVGRDVSDLLPQLGDIEILEEDKMHPVFEIRHYLHQLVLHGNAGSSLVIDNNNPGGSRK